MTADQIFGLSTRNFILLLTALIGIFGSIFIFWLRIQIRKRRLRMALRAEIRTMAEDIYYNADTMASKDPTGINAPLDTLIMTVYQNNSSEIGLLSTREVNNITEFYSLLQTIKSRLNKANDDSKITIDERRLLQRDFIRLNNLKNESLANIEKKLLFVTPHYYKNQDKYSSIQVPDYDLNELIESETKNSDDS